MTVLTSSHLQWKLQDIWEGKREGLLFQHWCHLWPRSRDMEFDTFDRRPQPPLWSPCGSLPNRFYYHRPTLAPFPCASRGIFALWISEEKMILGGNFDGMYTNQHEIRWNGYILPIEQLIKHQLKQISNIIGQAIRIGRLLKQWRQI